MQDRIYYFDNAATTFPKPEIVYKFMDEFYRGFGVNVGRGQYKAASKAYKLVEETREYLLNLFKANNKKVVFTHSATEALNIIIQGINISYNCNIYITPFEHNAVTRPLNYINNKHNINLHQLDVDKERMEYNISTIKDQFAQNNPQIVIMSHASNVCGLIAPVEEICKLAKSYDAITILDMSQTAGLVEINLGYDIFDFAVFAGHKTLYGPFGIAGFICSDKIKPNPLIFGGTGFDSANQDLPEEIPSRYEVGSINIQAIAGLNAALRWHKDTSFEKIFQKELDNYNKLIRVLNKYEAVDVITSKGNDKSIGVLSCNYKGYSSDNIGSILSNFNIAVRTGLHCAPYAHKFLGTFPSGTIRFSVSYFNEDEDFKMLDEALSFIEENV